MKAALCLQRSFVNRISKRRVLKGLHFCGRGNRGKTKCRQFAFITAIFNRLLQGILKRVEDVEMIAAWLMAFPTCRSQQGICGLDPFHMPAMHIANRFKELAPPAFQNKAPGERVMLICCTLHLIISIKL